MLSEVPLSQTVGTEDMHPTANNRTHHEWIYWQIARLTIIFNCILGSCNTLITYVEFSFSFLSRRVHWSHALVVLLLYAQIDAIQIMIDMLRLCKSRISYLRTRRLLSTSFPHTYLTIWTGKGASVMNSSRCLWLSIWIRINETRGKGLICITSLIWL